MKLPLCFSNMLNMRAKSSKFSPADPEFPSHNVIGLNSAVAELRLHHVSGLLCQTANRSDERLEIHCKGEDAVQKQSRFDAPDQHNESYLLLKKGTSTDLRDRSPPGPLSRSR